MSTKKASLQNDSKNDRGPRAEIHLDAATLHHAYGLVGERKTILLGLLDALARDVALPMGNSDLLLLDYESLTIDEARNIKAYASTRPNGERRAIVISARALTREAQNALLKSFEDPGEGLHFFLIVPSAHILLPTLRSRLSFVDIPELPLDEHSVSPNVDFISMSYKDRLEWIKDLTDKIKEGKQSKQDAVLAIKNIQKEAVIKFPLTSKNAHDALIHKEILLVLSYVTDTSASLKMLLEHIALVIPQK